MILPSKKRVTQTVVALAVCLAIVLCTAGAGRLDDKDEPVVPTVTDDETYLYRLGWFIGGLGNLKALDVLPYHTMGKEKYEKLGIPYRLEGVPAMDRPTLLLKKQAILKGIKDRRRHDG